SRCICRWSVFPKGARYARSSSSPEGDQCRRDPSYPRVVDELKRTLILGQRCRCGVVPYLNNIVEQDHRGIKRRVQTSPGFRSFGRAERTIQGYEAMHMI